MFGLVRAAVCGLLMIAPGIASAATLTATFSRDVTFSGFSGGLAGETAFVIDFDDTLGGSAGVLEGSEFLSFAWVNNPFTSTVPGPSFGTQARTLLAVAPSIAGLIEGFIVPSITNPFGSSGVNWVFRQAPASSTGTAVAASAFTYAFTPAPLPPTGPTDPSVVPLPAAGWMLLAGLGGLAALRRRRGA